MSHLAPLKHVAEPANRSTARATQVSDLAPLKRVPNLQSLYCSDTRVCHLAPLKRVPNLQSLYCCGHAGERSRPAEARAEPANRSDCSGTRVSDLSPAEARAEPANAQLLVPRR